MLLVAQQRQQHGMSRLLIILERPNIYIYIYMRVFNLALHSPTLKFSASALLPPLRVVVFDLRPPLCASQREDTADIPRAATPCSGNDESTGGFGRPLPWCRLSLLRQRLLSASASLNTATCNMYCCFCNQRAVLFCCRLFPRHETPREAQEEEEEAHLDSISAQERRDQHSRE